MRITSHLKKQNMKVGLFRYGAPPYNYRKVTMRNPPLSNIGREQVEELVKKIKERLDGVREIWTSNLYVARETAKIISKSLPNSRVVIKDKLLSNLRFGEDQKLNEKYAYEPEWLKEEIEIFENSKKGNLIIIGDLNYVREFPKAYNPDLEVLARFAEGVIFDFEEAKIFGLYWQKERLETSSVEKIPQLQREKRKRVWPK